MKRLNKGLVNHGVNRTVTALVKIEKAKAMLRREVVTGEIQARCNNKGILELSHADVSVAAGLGANFLNGPKHKESTKIDVETFIADLQEEFQERYLRESEQSNPIYKSARDGRSANKREIDMLRTQLSSVRTELDALKKRYERVATNMHVWANQLRSARAEIRQLHVQNATNVVQLARKESKNLPPRKNE